MPWLVREYQDEDFEGVVRLLDATGAAQASVFSFGECIVALRARQASAVAVHAGEVVGAVIAIVAADRAWVARLAISEELRGQGMASALLLALDRQLVTAHVRRVGYVLPHEELMADGLRKAGYEAQPAVAYFEKRLALEPGQAAVLDALGGEVLSPRLWDDLLGMREEKAVIERRVIAPLVHPELAAQHGVVAPRAVLLFGPPGTGKTTFARAVAAKLEWPFVELLPSRLAEEDAGLAAGLREAFAQLGQLDRVVVFIDEIEEIAAARQGAGMSRLHGVTNELLKVIPTFRQRSNRLLVAATNAVHSLDPAVVRPGRFDYVIPIGSPDEEARRALWGSHTRGSVVDLDSIVAASAHLTTAEIQHAAQSAAQASFERELLDDGAEAVTDGATTQDYLTAIGAIRPSLVPAIREAFEADTRTYARR
ncbi:MAG: GNAT family N-acetyltransferase [Chloroflexota bacterium]